jgi:hypothetical protein
MIDISSSCVSTLPLRPQAQQDRAGRDGNGQSLSERLGESGGIIWSEPKVIAMGLHHSEEDLVYVRIRIEVTTPIVVPPLIENSHYRLAPCKTSERQG